MPSHHVICPYIYPHGSLHLTCIQTFTRKTYMTLQKQCCITCITLCSILYYCNDPYSLKAQHCIISATVGKHLTVVLPWAGTMSTGDVHEQELPQSTRSAFKNPPPPQPDIRTWRAKGFHLPGLQGIKHHATFNSDLNEIINLYLRVWLLLVY